MKTVNRLENKRKDSIHHKDFENKMMEFQSDCTKCKGLCCTALFFSKIDGFPEDKPAGRPCCNLQEDFRCKIHSELEEKKMRGCIGYDCLGAGQWATENGKADIFTLVCQLFQIRYYLTEATTIKVACSLWEKLQEVIQENEMLCNQSIKCISPMDVEMHRDKANVLLRKVCDILQEKFQKNPTQTSVDYLGKNLKNRNFTGYNLSTQLLIAANFEKCIFYGTNFLGADMRDANLSDTDLRDAVFLTPAQVNSAKGNQKTKLPPHLQCPITWK